MLVRLIRALIDEFLMVFKMDSKFLDSPLNFEGIEQALELRRFIESTAHPELKKAPAGRADIFEILRGEKGKPASVVVSSTLRRAVSTTTLALWPRLERTGEKMYVLSSLQEISRNVDTRALSDPKDLADLPFSRLSGHCKPQDGEFDPAKVYDLTENFGNKTRTFYGIKRLQSFNEWAFQRSEPVIIVGGHSLWFKSFFQTYLPFKMTHEAKSKKITNSGVVSFTLHRAEGPDGSPRYRIEPDSIQVVYGGFTTK
jgi:hypothetical protein